MRKHKSDVWWQRFGSASEATLNLMFKNLSGYTFSSDKEQMDAIKFNLQRFGEEMLPSERESLEDDLRRLTMQINGTWEAYQREESARFHRQLRQEIIEMQKKGLLPLTYKGRPFLSDN